MNKLIIRTIVLGTLSLGLTSCFPVRIVTTAPTQTVYVRPTQTVTTVSTVPASSSRPTTTTTVQVNALTSDLSFYLDLQAVAAAFAQSSSVREFEQLLNSSRYMINNLDLNGDGYVDYLRVLEAVQGYRHVYLIQACLAANIYQDVATLVAEARATDLYVEIIGDPYIYGTQYIVRPVWVKRPTIWSHLYHTGYTPWVSTYCHGHFPSYYKYPKPMYLSHYQAYVEQYMRDHHFCHHCDYPSSYYDPHYYDHVRSYGHHDYEQQYPQNSFTNRNSRVYTATPMNNTPGAAHSSTQRTVRNAADLREAAAASTTRTSGTPTPSRSNSSTQSTTTSTGSATTSGRTSSTSATTTPSSSSSSSTSRTSSTSGSSSSSSSSTTSRTSGSSSTSNSSRTSTTTATPTTTTTISTRVSPSGTTRTQIRSTDRSGRTTSTTRTTTPSRTRTTSTESSTSTRQSSTPSSGSSSGTRTRK